MRHHSLIGIVILWASLASAATYHAGLDVAQVLPLAKPGDVIVLEPGVYPAPLVINCQGSARSGTAGQPITLKARQERQSWIKGDGTTGVVLLKGCHYWVLDGLHVSSQDALVGDGLPAVIDVRDSSHLVFKRLLVHHNNRYNNNPLLLLLHTSHSLVEESEFYWFHRHAVATKHGTHNVFRRNYFNSRWHADIPGGRYSGYADRGDAGITVYPGSFHVVENNVSENNAVLWDIMAIDTSVENRFLGNISLRDHFGTVIKARGASAAMMPQRNTIEQFVVIQPTYAGVYARGTKETLCRGCAFWHAPQGLVADIESTYPGDGVASVFGENLLTSQNGVGVTIIDQRAWGVTGVAWDRNQRNINPIDAPQVQHALTVRESLGGCLVAVPEGSPLKRAGIGGQDLGANVITRYANGALTPEPLWVGLTRQFPCGAAVPGVNDDPGTSCRGVHERLQVTHPDCAMLIGGPPVVLSGPLPPPVIRLIR